eukprot:scaffold971_cov107-Isochrysis_galbana.AAC.4
MQPQVPARFAALKKSGSLLGPSNRRSIPAPGASTSSHYSRPSQMRANNAASSAGSLPCTPRVASQSLQSELSGSSSHMPSHSLKRRFRLPTCLAPAPATAAGWAWPGSPPSRPKSLASTWKPLAASSRCRGTRRASNVSVSVHGPREMSRRLPAALPGVSSMTRSTHFLAAHCASMPGARSATSVAAAIVLDSPNVSWSSTATSILRPGSSRTKQSKCSSHLGSSRPSTARSSWPVAFDTLAEAEGIRRSPHVQVGNVGRILNGDTQHNQVTRRYLERERPDTEDAQDDVGRLDLARGHLDAARRLKPRAVLREPCRGRLFGSGWPGCGSGEEGGG